MNSSGFKINSEALIGKIIADRYILLGTLGSGAMGTVYKARHKHLNREVALKVLRRDACADDLSRKRFENEAKAASKLHHQNLIAVTDFGFAEGLGENGIDSPFLVMDYVEGVSLAHLLKQIDRLPDEQFLNILVQICAGLAHAHEKGLVHRDLKPSNILVTRTDEDHEIVKVVDFGLAKAINENQDLTNSGQIFGTPLYMSPEQCQGRKLDARSDVYSLGCLMYRMLTGKVPFTGDSPVTTIIMHVKEAPPAIPEEKLDTAYRRALAPVIFKALEKEPSQRQQSVNELRIELISAMEQSLKDSLLSDSSTHSQTAKFDTGSVNRKMLFLVAASTMLPLIVVAGVISTLLMPKPASGPMLKAPVKLAAPANASLGRNNGALAVSPPALAPFDRKGATTATPLAAPSKHVSPQHRAVKHPATKAKKRGFWKNLMKNILD
jgi:serine/threonine protein kinase